MNTGGGIIGTLGGTGLTLSDGTRHARTFRITGGSNPYQAQEISLDNIDGTTSDQYGITITSSVELWELAGRADVPVGAKIIAYPIPGSAVGFTFLYGHSNTSSVLDQCRQVITTCPIKDAEGVLVGITVSYRGWCGAITAASWSSSVATITAPGHPLVTGDTVIITGVDPNGYNGTFTVISTSGDDFTVAVASDPGSYVEGGIVSAPYAVYCVEDPDDCCETSTALELSCCSTFAATNPITAAMTNRTNDATGYTTNTSRTWEWQSGGADTWVSEVYYVGPPSGGAVEVGLHHNTDNSLNIAVGFVIDCNGGNPRVTITLTASGTVSVNSAGAGWTTSGGSGVTKALSCATWNPSAETVGTFTIDNGGTAGTFDLVIS